MSETKTRQQVILLHGSSEFTLAKAQEKVLAQGELVIEHGENGVKLHTLDKDNKLATFINEAAINTKIDGVQTTVEQHTESINGLKETVGDATKGLVMDVNAHALAIQELRESLGIETPGEGELDTTLSGRIAALEATVGGETSGLVYDFKEHKEAYEEFVEAYNGKIEAVDGHIEAVTEMLAGYSNNKTVASDVAAAKTEVKALVKEGETANKYVSVTSSTGDKNQTIYSIDVTGFADGEAFDEVAEQVKTLIGNDATKSVRTIANEELAAKLLSGEADADFKTLQELAAWLENHPEDVATMNSERAVLEAALGTFVSRTDDGLANGTQTVSEKFASVDETVEDIGERLVTVEGNYIKTITVNTPSGVKVEAVKDGDGKYTNTWNFDFSEIVINGGEY